MEVTKDEILDRFKNLTAIAEENSASTEETAVSIRDQLEKMKKLKK